MTHTSSLPVGTAVGTGARGGVLVTTSSGGVKEVFQSVPSQLSDPARESFIRSGGGGSGRRAAILRAARERAAREKLAREKAAREKAARERAARERAILNKKERRSLLARQEIKRMALERGKAFTQRQIRKFLIEQKGSISALRSATRKGFRVVKKKLISPKKPFTPIPKRKIVIKFPSIQKIRDITSLGLTKERRETEKINKRIEDFNKRQEEFEKKFIGRTLKEGEFKNATKEQEKLEKELKSIEDQEKLNKKSVPTKSLDFLKSSRIELRKERIKEIKKLGVKAVIGSSKLRKIDNRLQSLTLVESGVSFGIAVLTLPETIKNIISNPSQLKKIPSSLATSGKNLGKLALISPNEAIAQVGAEVLLLKGTGSTFKVVGKLSAKNSARVLGKLRKIEKGVINISKSKKGITLSTKLTKSKTTKKGLLFGKKTTRLTIKEKKGLQIKIAKPGLQKLATTLKKQKELAGKRIPLVTSAQADRLLGIIRRKRVIRKPIPGENQLTRATRKLLGKFDKGSISKRQLIELDRKIKIETKGQGSILERSFFVDPEGRIRISRLGIQKEASLLDILKGDFTFKTQKPQILIFEDIKVQAFPKTEIFKSIKNKLNTKNPKLTSKESQALITFQSKVSGKFKPVGALTKEPELTLAAGEIIKKVKTLAKVEINGRIVSIVKAKIIKAKPSTRKLLRRARQGKLSKKGLRKLERNIKKETGFKTSLSRRAKRIKPRARLPKRIPGRRIKRRPQPRKFRRPTKRPIRRPPKRPTGRPTTRPPIRPPIRPVGRPSKRPTRPPRRPTIRPIGRPLPIPRLTKRKRIGRKRKRKQGFNVFARPVKRRKGQKKPKLIRINKVPLSIRKAKDLRNFIIDTSLARTGKIKKTKGKVQNPRLRVSPNFSKRTSKKFRRFKIVKGKRKPLARGKVIERRRHLLDTRSEKRKIGLRRRLKQLERTSRQKPRKRIKRRSFKGRPSKVRILSARSKTKRKPTRRKAKRGKR